jgi:hypothetical protein
MISNRGQLGSCNRFDPSQALETLMEHFQWYTSEINQLAEVEIHFFN